MSEILNEMRQRQGGWSETANVLKKRFERQRNVALGLSLGGALLATAAGHLDGQWRWIAVATSTLMFAAVAFLTKKSHGDATAQPWVRARAISESLKRLAYTYAARGKGYSDPAKRDAAARDALADAHKECAPYLNSYIGDRAGSTPDADLTPEIYLQRRVDSQISFYQSKADTYKQLADRWRTREFGLAFATAVLTGAAGFVGKKTDWGVDFAAFAAVLTTFSGAILSHIEASKFDFLVASYRATALRLRDAKLSLGGQLPAIDAPEWAKFVGQCEQHIATENGSWMLKIGKI